MAYRAAFFSRQLLWGFGLLFPLLAASATVMAEPKRVLGVHSFGSAAPPFTIASTAFETALTEAMGRRVDLDEVSLESARFSSDPQEGPTARYLRATFAGRRLKLIVSIGGPAVRFAQKYREQLSPVTPVGWRRSGMNVARVDGN